METITVKISRKAYESISKVLKARKVSWLQLSEMLAPYFVDAMNFVDSDKLILIVRLEF